MRIEIVLPTLAVAGMETVVARLTEGLSARGHDVGVTCILAKGPLADTLEQAGIRVTLVPTLGLRTNLVPTQLSRWFVRRQPDVVHVHSGAWLKAARAARVARVPRIVFTMHGIDGRLLWYEPLLERWAARHTDAIVTVSEAFCSYLLRRVHVAPGKLSVITNGVDTRRYSPGPRTDRVRRQFGLDETDVVIGHVARFTPVKNHALLADAMQMVLEEQDRAFLALVGDGPLRPAIESQVDRLGIRSRVGFLGQIDDLPALYRDLDVLVLSSLSEASSMSILEGMASGLPIVATAVGGTPELLGHGEAGVLAATGNARSLAAKLIDLTKDAEERTRLGRMARERVLTYYGEEQMLDAYENVYASPNGSPAP